MAEMRKLVLVCGYRRTGKDTLADALISGKDVKELYPAMPFILPNIDNPIKLSLAGKLKQDVMDIIGYPVTEDNKDLPLIHPEVLSPMFHVNDKTTVRDILIQFGSLMRSYDPDHWIKALVSQIESYPNNDVIITDVRFPNEIEFLKTIRNRDVITIRVYRNSVPIPNSDIESEHSLDDYTTDYLLCDTAESYMDGIERFVRP